MYKLHHVSYICIWFSWNCLACQNVLNPAPRGLWQNLRMDLSSLRREFEISVEIMKYALIVWISPFGLLNCLNYADWRLWSLVSVWSCKVFGHACYRLKAYIFLNFTNTTWIQYIVSWTFWFAIPACEHFWVGSGWSLSIYLVFQLVCKSNLGGTVWWRVFVLAPVGNSTDLIVITLFAQQLFCTTFNGFYLRF